MKTFLVVLSLLFIPMHLLSQQNLRLGGDVYEILSSQDKDLRGILNKPKFSPHSTNLFSFVRQLADNRYVYIYNVSTQQLTEISPIKTDGELEINPDFRAPESSIYNDQFDWRPVKDTSDRQWFAFVFVLIYLNIHIFTFRNKVYPIFRYHFFNNLF